MNDSRTESTLFVVYSMLFFSWLKYSVDLEIFIKNYVIKYFVSHMIIVYFFIFYKITNTIEKLRDKTFYNWTM